MDFNAIVIIGGGAAGLFAALTAKKTDPDRDVIVLEKSALLLSKVKISGGGRCNVTHACFDPKQLVLNYPRGHKELLGPFHTFQPLHTIEWFEKRGCFLKTEEDGRVFPVTDSSATIIECLLQEARTLGVTILKRHKIETIERGENKFEIVSTQGNKIIASSLILATGSGPDGYAWAKQWGHTIEEPVPSLFTFNIPDFSLSHLSGIALPHVEVKLVDAPFSQRGPLLITHFGYSGPAVLKLSAWAARFLHRCHYQTEIAINWLPDYSEEEIYQYLRKMKLDNPHKKISHTNPFSFPKNFWKTFNGVDAEETLLSLPDKKLRKIGQKLHRDLYTIQGKTTHKEEFVTCGGIALNEIDFKSMKSKLCPGLFFAGEVIDIDGVTGGFNFQNAWTTGYLAGLNAC